MTARIFLFRPSGRSRLKRPGYECCYMTAAGRPAGRTKQKGLRKRWSISNSYYYCLGMKFIWDDFPVSVSKNTAFRRFVTKIGNKFKLLASEPFDAFIELR